MRIEKKIWPPSFQRILDGDKTFEIRLADFACSPGDVLFLREWDPETKEYTGRTTEKKVSYIAKTKNLPYWSEEEIEKHGLQVIAFR